MHQPARWLPQQYANWNDFLTAAIERGLEVAHAPVDLNKWRYGTIHKLDFEHPVFDQSPALSYVYGLKTGTGELPQSGDGTTIKQVGRTFGPSERFTADLADLDKSTLNLLTGESGNPMSDWFMDQFPAWYRGTTFAMPFGDAAVEAAVKHRLTLLPAGK
jgi:penicillin amidase